MRSIYIQYLFSMFMSYVYYWNTNDWILFVALAAKKGHYVNVEIFLNIIIIYLYY